MPAGYVISTFLGPNLDNLGPRRNTVAPHPVPSATGFGFADRADIRILILWLNG
jgi:hypothetical protein